MITTSGNEKTRENAKIMKPLISPVRGLLKKFKEEREKREEAMISDEGERLRKAIENNSFLLVRRLLDVPGKHEEADRTYPRGVITPVAVDALREINKRGWTILHALCYHGAPASLIIHTITRILTEKSEYDSDYSSSSSESEEEDIGIIDWEASDDIALEYPAEVVAKQELERRKEREEMKKLLQMDKHPVSLLDDMKNNLLHLLFSRSTKEGDGTKRPLRSETQNIIRITKVMLTFNSNLMKGINLNGHTPLHLLLSSSGNNCSVSLQLLEIMKKCHPTFLQDATPSNVLPLHLLCLNNSSLKIVEQVVRWYPEAARALDNKGRTPLHCLLMNTEPKIPIVQLLLEEYHYSLSVVDKMGRTPLITAVVTAGAENPPPMALMKLLKSDNEWYGGGSEKYPHVHGCDFDYIDVTSPSVQHATKIHAKPPNTGEEYKRRLSPNKRRALKKRIEASDHKFHIKSKRLPPNFHKKMLEAILPASRALKLDGTELMTKIPILKEKDHPSIKKTFDWFKDGHVIGPNFEGNMPSTAIRNYYRNKIRKELRESMKTIGKGISSRLYLLSDDTNINAGSNVPFQLSSTKSGNRRKEIINQMTLSPRYKEKMQTKALSSRDYDRPLLRSVELHGSLRSKYYKQPILIRNETPVGRKNIRLNLPEHPVDARDDGHNKKVTFL